MALPAQGEWPCQQATDGDLPSRLVGFLYLLYRQGLTVGKVEELLMQVRDDNKYVDFTNPHTEQLARAHAQYLLEEA